MTTRNVDNFILKSFTVGPLEVNCYAVGDPRTREACLLDPGAEPEKMRDFLSENGLELKFIVNTHGHGDHIAANASFGVPVYIHSLDSRFLTDPQLNLSAFTVFPIRSPRAARLLDDNETVALGSLTFEIIHTPGHTPGSISVGLNGVIFTGDTLFRGGVGRTDFAYGDGAALIRSIRERLLCFDDKTVIYPGHGPSSTIGEERRNNTFL